MSATEKECRDCKRTLPMTRFYTHQRMGDGHLNKCKECVKLRVRVHRRRHSERVMAYDRIKALRKPRARAVAPRNPAYSKVKHAVDSGRLTRKPCEVCGETKVEAHHFDYSRPLDVVWLCIKHHRRAHAVAKCGSVMPGDEQLHSIAFPNMGT